MVTTQDIYKLYQQKAASQMLLNAFSEVAIDDKDHYCHHRTPLHLACDFADTEAIRILLERGAEVNAKDDRGYTPLCNLGMLRGVPMPNEDQICASAILLLEHGASVNRSAKETTALIEAIRNRHHQMVAAIIASGSKCDATDMNGENALHVACQVAGYITNDIRNTEQKIAWFADRWYSDEDKQQTRYQLKELHEEEVRFNQIVKKLLECDMIDPEERNKSGKTAFDLAMECGARWIGALLSGLNPETDELAARSGGLDIFQALYYQDMRAVDALLCSGIELQTVCEHEAMSGFYGKSPLACALVWDNVEAVKMLLRAGADTNWKSPEERTAFASWMEKDRGSTSEGESAILELMTQYGWLIEAAVDKEENSALSFACRHAYKEIGNVAIHYLVGIGADVNVRNSQGQTPLMNLYGGRFWNGNIPVFAGLPRSYPYGSRYCDENDAETLEFLLGAGAKADATDQWGNSILHYIAGSSQGRSKKAAEMVFDFGPPDVTALNNEGKTAIDIAVEQNDEALVKLLLRYS